MTKTGKNIRYFRMLRNMTQDELAEKLAVTRQTISNYENGKSQPDIETLTKLSEILDADINKLIYGKDFGEQEKNSRKMTKAEKICFVALTLLTAGAIIAYVMFSKWALDYSATTYILYPKMIAVVVFKPICFLLAAIWIMRAMTIIFRIDIRKKRVVKWAKIISMVLLGVYIVFLSYYCFWYNEIVYIILAFAWGNSWLFALLGLVLGIRTTKYTN